MTHLAHEPRFTASEWAAMLVAPLRDQRYRELPAGPLVVEWLTYKRLEDSADMTVDAYERILARFLTTTVPHKTAADVTTADVMSFLATLPAASRRKARAALSGFFKWAMIFDYVERNPMLRTPTFPKPRREVYVLFTEAERSQLEALPIEDGALMALLFGSGIRDGEARKVRVCDVREAGYDQEGRPRHVLFVDGKGRKKRLVPLPPNVVGTVHRLVLEHGLNGDDHLWYSSKSNGRYRRVSRAKPVSYPSFVRWWCRCLVDAGIVPDPGIPRAPDWLAWEKAVRAQQPAYRSPHMTRHTYATEFLRRNEPIDRLSRILGHSSVAVTDEAYSHLVTDDLADSVERAWG